MHRFVLASYIYTAHNLCLLTVEMMLKPNAMWCKQALRFTRERSVVHVHFCARSVHFLQLLISNGSKTCGIYLKKLPALFCTTGDFSQRGELLRIEQAP